MCAADLGMHVDMIVISTSVCLQTVGGSFASRNIALDFNVVLMTVTRSQIKLASEGSLIQ